MSDRTPEDAKARETRLRRDTDDDQGREVTIETVDRAMLYQFKERFDLSVAQNGRSIDVPVIFDKPERWRWAAEQEVKSTGDRIVYPILVLKRDSVDTDEAMDNPNKGAHLFGPDSGQSFVARRQYSAQNRFDNFAALNDRRPVYEYFLVQMPKYLDISYSCTLHTEYQVHANALTERISYQGRSYWGDPSRWLFWCEASGFTSDVEEAEGDTRFVRTEFGVDVKGYILPDRSMKEPTTRKRLTAAKTVFEEHVVTEIPD